MKIDNNIDFIEYVKNLSFIEAQSILPVTQYLESTLEFALHGGAVRGSQMPWQKTHDTTRLGLGKLSVWAGENGSGKSLLLGQVITHLISQGRKAVIASLEMKPEETVYRMICQSATCHASREYTKKWVNHFMDKLWLYNELDRVDTNRLLAMCHWAANELGVKDIVIDSLTKCGVGRDDYAAQAQFVDKLQFCAKRWNIHIHLVCHMRKGDKQSGKSGKDDIRGAGEITDLADNVYIISRNKAKEQEIDRKLSGREYNQEIADMPSTFLSVEKNREFGIEKKFALYHHHKSGSFLESENLKFKPLEL